MKEVIRKPKVIALIISAIIILALVAVGVIFWQPFYEIASDQGRTQQLIESTGAWGPLVFILLQIVQVVVAPIPGQVTGVVGGYLFGWELGTVYTTIGGAIGFTLVFWLARKLGRPFLEYFFDKKLIGKFDYLAESKGVLVLFLIFLIPAFPDDLICYIAGLTTIKIRTLVLISLAGRLPSTLFLSFAGAGIAQSNEKIVLIIASLMIAAFGLAYWKRKPLEKWIKSLTKSSADEGDKPNGTLGR